MSQPRSQPRSLTPEQRKLKDFVALNFPWEPLRKAGFWGPAVRKSDYPARAARVCAFFAYASVYDYGQVQLLTSAHAALALLPGEDGEPGTPAILALSA